MPTLGRPGPTRHVGALNKYYPAPPTCQELFQAQEGPHPGLVGCELAEGTHCEDQGEPGASSCRGNFGENKADEEARGARVSGQHRLTNRRPEEVWAQGHRWGWKGPEAKALLRCLRLLMFDEGAPW